MYTVIYDDDLCYHKESFFITFKLAKNWVGLYKHNWMRWKVYDENNHLKFGGCNGNSYNGT